MNKKIFGVWKITLDNELPLRFKIGLDESNLDTSTYHLDYSVGFDIREFFLPNKHIGFFVVSTSEGRLVWANLSSFINWIINNHQESINLDIMPNPGMSLVDEFNYGNLLLIKIWEWIDERIIEFENKLVGTSLFLLGSSVHPRLKIKDYDAFEIPMPEIYHLYHLYLEKILKVSG